MINLLKLILAIILVPFFIVILLVMAGIYGWYDLEEALTQGKHRI